MPLDLKLDTHTHDLDLKRGTVKLTKTNSDAVGQRVKIAILTKQGEWFKNQLEGIPYYTEFFRSKNNKGLIDQFMIEYIRKIQDVLRVTNYNSTITPDRVLHIEVSVQTYSGEVVTAKLEA